jgi:uncharacterized protein YoxC
MNTLLLGVIALAFLVGVIIFIIIMFELRGAIKELKDLIGTTERSMKPTFVELQETLKSIRNFVDNINEVTEDVRVFSDSVKEVGEGVKSVSENVKHVSTLVENMTASTMAEASGIKAGIKAGLFAILKNLFKQN